VRLPLIAPSLGGLETLIEQPALMSFYELSDEERRQVGIKGNLVRLSVGVEDVEDLLEDLAQALERAQTPASTKVTEPSSPKTAQP
jgi:cystathionine gamma-synthase